MKKIEALGPATEHGATLEFVTAEDGSKKLKIVFPYHSPRFLDANPIFLLEKIEAGERYFDDENYSIHVYKKVVKITLFRHESGHTQANFAMANFMSLLEDA